jgi:hypothetical protein
MTLGYKMSLVRESVRISGFRGASKALKNIRKMPEICKS